MQIVAPKISFQKRCADQHRVSPNSFKIQDDCGNTWSTCFDCGAAVLIPAPEPPHWLSRFCSSGVGFAAIACLGVYLLICVTQQIAGQR